MSAVRENWRVFALVFLIGLSAIGLFAPPGTIGATADATGATNLKYGIELSGGARIRAPVAGWTAENVSVGNNTEQIENVVRRQLDVDRVDVVASRGQRAQGVPTVEVFAQPITRDGFSSDAAFREAENASRNVSRREVVRALQTAGLDAESGDVRRGVTTETIDTIVQTIQRKINAAGLSGGSTRVATTATGERFIVVQAPNRDVQDLRDLISQRGTVEVRTYYPVNGSYTNQTVIDQEMRRNFSVGPPNYDEQGGYHFVTITFEKGSADTRRFRNDMVEYGFASGGANCPPGPPGSFTDAAPPQRCLLTVFDGEVIYSAGVRPRLGEDWASGDWLDDPTFIMQTNSQEQARELQIALKAGRLPASLDFQRGTTLFLEPALAQQFKINSLITGIIAVLAVAGVVYLRYGDRRIALPMIVTALSEVVVLLGFAAGIGYPLDLSVIAGFIAVIGTGVDDLIIIADEVMAEGDVESARVFQSRFRKAFWVIGAAAATTILAMSPLAVLSLGDLQGFAIVTILGVLVGVLITRPAYGDILRRLITTR